MVRSKLQKSLKRNFTLQTLGVKNTWKCLKILASFHFRGGYSDFRLNYATLLDSLTLVPPLRLRLIVFAIDYLMTNQDMMRNSTTKNAIPVISSEEIRQCSLSNPHSGYPMGGTM